MGSQVLNMTAINYIYYIEFNCVFFKLPCCIKITHFKLFVHLMRPKNTDVGNKISVSAPCRWLGNVGSPDLALLIALGRRLFGIGRLVKG